MDRLELVEVTFPGGQTMLARVHAADPVDAGPRDVGLREQLSFSGVTDTLREIGGAVVEALEQVRPERASVEFGLDLAVKSGKLSGLLVEGDATAALRVTLEWEQAQPSPATADS
jgi:hypothetical protein